MTVEQLIDLLQSYPKDMTVVNSFGILGEDSIKIVKEYYNSDSGNPNCKILNNVLYFE